MTKSKNTKCALLASVLSVVLCASMLVGSTFAWFTDSVTSGKNKIVAGNLDVELYAKDTEGNYIPVAADESLFDNAALWEPGHTEIAYLKVENLGSLALKYQFAVRVDSETPGTNVADESFKLSDHLVFGQATGTTETVYQTREEAWAAAGDTKGLEDYVEAGVLTSGAEEYVALVVYMPTSVGNAANYKTGTTPPSIELSVSLIATQVPYESDSFGKDYDKNADGSPDYAFGAITGTDTKVTVPVVADGDTILENTDATATVSVPSGAVADGASSLTLSIQETDTPANIVVAADQASKAYEVKVSGVAANNTTPITAKVFIGKNLTGVKMFHNSDELADAVYDADTGFVTFTTTSFSPFTAVFNKEVTVMDAETLQLVSSVDGIDITLGADISSSSPVIIPLGNTASINLGGYALTATSNSCIINYGTLTSVTNGTVKGKYYGIVNDKNGTIGEIHVNAQSAHDAIYNISGVIEKISGGSYHGHPDVYTSGDAGSCGLYNGSAGTVKLISGGTFQGSSVAFRSYGTIESVTGGRFECPYMDANNRTFCDNTTIGNVFYNNAPNSVSGGTWYNIGTKLNGVLTDGFAVVQGEKCTMTSGKTYVRYNAETGTPAHWEEDSSGKDYYYSTVVSAQAE